MHVAYICAKPETRPLAQTFVTEVDKDVWVPFPWGAGTGTDTCPRFVLPITGSDGPAAMSASHSWQLLCPLRRQRPIWRIMRMVELRGFEPLTFALRTRRSPN